MPLTYDDSAYLMQDNAFRGRVKVACLKYADYIVGEAPDVPAHSTRVKWAQQTMTAPDASAAVVTPTVVMDAAVQAAGLTTANPPTSAIDDAGLQSSTEVAINKML